MCSSGLIDFRFFFSPHNYVIRAVFRAKYVQGGGIIWHCLVYGGISSTRNNIIGHVPAKLGPVKIESNRNGQDHIIMSTMKECHNRQRGMRYNKCESSVP